MCFILFTFTLTVSGNGVIICVHNNTSCCSHCVWVLLSRRHLPYQLSHLPMQHVIMHSSASLFLNLHSEIGNLPRLLSTHSAVICQLPIATVTSSLVFRWRNWGSKNWPNIQWKQHIWNNSANWGRRIVHIKQVYKVKQLNFFTIICLLKCTSWYSSVGWECILMSLKENLLYNNIYIEKAVHDFTGCCWSWHSAACG